MLVRLELCNLRLLQSATLCIATENEICTRSRNFASRYLIDFSKNALKNSINFINIPTRSFNELDIKKAFENVNLGCQSETIADVSRT